MNETQVIATLTDPGFRFTIKEQNVADPSSSFSLIVSGHIDGTFRIAPGAPQPNFFNYSGEATSIRIVDPSGAAIPQDLLSLASNPGRIHIVEIGTEESVSGSVQTYLTIDPSAGAEHPVPEPTSLMIFAIPFAGLVLYERTRKRVR